MILAYFTLRRSCIFHIYVERFYIDFMLLTHYSQQNKKIKKTRSVM
jgi:hypothetical protein